MATETSPAAIMTTEELERVSSIVDKAVRAAVSQVVPSSELHQLTSNVDKIMKRLDEVADMLEHRVPEPSRSARSARGRPVPLPKTRTWTGQLGLFASQAVAGIAPASQTPGTLREVSDQLFTEILNAKDVVSHREHSGSMEAILNGSPSDFRQPEQQVPSKLPALQEARSAYAVQDDNDDCSLHNSNSQPRSNFDKNGGDFADVAPSLPGRVAPRLDNPDDPSVDEAPQQSVSLQQMGLKSSSTAAKGPRTANNASQIVQSEIIKSCTDKEKLDFEHSFVPVVGCILRRSRAFVCMLMFLALFAGLRIAAVARGFPFVYLVRDLSVLIFTLAGLASSRMLHEAWLHTEKMAHWATASSCVDDWIHASHVKQRVLLWWWMAVLAMMAAIEVMITYHAIAYSGLLNAEISRALLWIGCEVMSLASFGTSTGLLLSAACMQCHIISALNVFVDEWSCELCEYREFSDSVLKWNTVQALIRRAGTSFENAFAAIQVAALLGLGVVATWIIKIFASQPDEPMGAGLADFKGILDVSTTLPLLMLSILAGHLLLQCASITEKCIILPPIANQIMTDTFDVERQYLVDYLSNSAAGIYVKGVKLDMLMVTNIVYFVCVAISAFFGIAMRLHNSSSCSE